MSPTRNAFDSNRTCPPRPLDAAALDRLALRYVERYATTRARLAAYLARKVRERGWSGETVDTAVIADRMAALGYVDDRGFAAARAAALARRGLGARRVAMDWQAAGIDPDDTAAIAPEVTERATAAAMAFARRKRIGPFGSGDPDREQRQRQLGAMIRAGHPSDLARRIIAMPPETDNSKDL